MNEDINETIEIIYKLLDTSRRIRVVFFIFNALLCAEEESPGLSETDF